MGNKVNFGRTKTFLQLINYAKSRCDIYTLEPVVCFAWLNAKNKRRKKKNNLMLHRSVCVLHITACDGTTLIYYYIQNILCIPQWWFLQCRYIMWRICVILILYKVYWLHDKPFLVNSSSVQQVQHKRNQIPKKGTWLYEMIWIKLLELLIGHTHACYRS